MLMRAFGNWLRQENPVRSRALWHGHCRIYRHLYIHTGIKRHNYGDIDAFQHCIRDIYGHASSNLHCHGIIYNNPDCYIY